jgi:hypothetical protein
VLHNALHPLAHHRAVLNLSEGLLAAHLLADALVVGVVVLVVGGAHHTLLLGHHHWDLQREGKWQKGVVRTY